MKITRLQAENFKKLRAVEIVPGDGPVVPIRGRNAQGKSSVLDAIQAALGGKTVMPAKPVRNGEAEGAVRLELDDGAIVIRRTFDTEGGGQIVVESADGARFPSPQKLLDGLYASVAFDPLAFTREKPAEQARILRSLVKLDVDPDAIERQNRTDYEDRRDINRELKAEQARLAIMPVIDAAPSDEIDLAPLEARIVEATTHNGTVESRRMRREATECQIGEWRDQVVSLEARIAEAQGKLDTVDPLPELIDVADAQEQLRAARETNSRVGAARARKAQEMLVASLEARSGKLTQALEGRQTQLAEAFAKAEMPVDGLSFADGTVLMNGVPFEQASSAEQLRVSSAIGMAGNPKLRVMLVRDGSLLDPDGEALLAAMAAEKDFQLWVEAVDASGKVGIVLEDGTVASVDGEDAPEPAPIEKARRRQYTPAPDDSTVQAGEGEGPRTLSPELAVAESLFGDD